MSDNDLLLEPQTRLDCMFLELQKGFINDLYWLLKESNSYDALINIGDSPNIKSFKAHKSILSARSLYFRAILSNSNSNKKNSFIEITQTNIQPDIFEVILKFIYTGRIFLEGETDAKILFDYIIAAEKLWLYHLIHYIENYLIYQMSDWLKSNFTYVLIMINSNPSSFKLLREFVDDMLKNHSYLLFDSDDFHTIPKNILIQILQHRKFSKNICESKVWNNILDWGIKQNDDLIDKDIRNWTNSDFRKLQTTLQHCIPLIRFSDIPPKIFYNIVDPYKKVLTPELYQRTVQCPTFANYSKLLFPSSPIRSILSSISYKMGQNESFSPIPSPILNAFPKPPSPTPSQSTVTSSFIDTESLLLSRSNSSVSTVSTVSTETVKHILEDTSIKKPKNDVSPKSTYTAKKKSKSTIVYSIKASEKSLSSIKERLKRSNTTPKKSEITSPDPVTELETSLRKMKRHFNRKTSIISCSRPPLTSLPSNMSVAILPEFS
uniref:Actin-binding protein IPP n=1 Tax=Anthurium amnicola TaxID=1678845 RepID=A0A1D1YLU2_9ARAE